MPNKNKPSNIKPLYQFYDAKKEAEKNTFGKRLNAARRAKGLSLQALSDELTNYNIYIQPPAIWKWEQGATTPNVYQTFSLCRILGIEDGIRYFSGPLHPGELALNEQGLKKLEAYREDLLDTGKYMIQEQETDNDDYIQTRLYNLPVSAGTGMFLDSDDYENITVNTSTVPYGADFAVQVRGDSMTPNYLDGQMVWVQETPMLKNKDIGIFILNGCGYIKMYTEIEPNEDELEEYQNSDGVVMPKIELVSLNRNYNPIPVGEFDDLRIIGKVLTK